MIKLPVTPECKGCKNILEDGTCYRYAQPPAWWRAGRKCPMATHLKKDIADPRKKERKRVGQQKQTKKKK